MKKIIRLIAMVLILISLCGCQGNYEPIDFEEAIQLSEEGIVEADVLEQLKENNSVGNFVGECGDYKYEWIIFGSDISTIKNLNLLVTIEEGEQEEVQISFAEKESFDFPILLSIHLNEKWNAQSATLYCEDAPVGTVAITGSKNSILNVTVQGKQSGYVIRAEQEQESEKLLAKVETAEPIVKNTTEKQQDVVVPEKDEYLSKVEAGSNRVYSSGNGSQKDKYETDPIPEGKPMPVEPENQEISAQVTHTCTFSIECTTILNNLEDLDSDKLELVPSDGVILAPVEVTFYDGESVFDVLQRVCQENGIHMEASWTPIYNSAYIEGINNLYEFDCGELSGWVYCVNGWYPNYGCSRYQLAPGEVVEWRYTCDLGRDVGCDWME